ncbi:heat shock 22 kDa protein, mitochondrial isoform X1 [Tanacetum coccineum]
MRFPRLVHSDEDGLCLDMHMPGMDSRHLSVCVEDNTLVCEGTRPDGKLYLREFDDSPPNKKYTRPAGIKPETQFCAGTGTYIGWMSLPKKMYRQTDVQATMKEVSIIGLTSANSIGYSSWA